MARVYALARLLNRLNKSESSKAENPLKPEVLKLVEVITVCVHQQKMGGYEERQEAFRRSGTAAKFLQGPGRFRRFSMWLFLHL